MIKNTNRGVNTEIQRAKWEAKEQAETKSEHMWETLLEGRLFDSYKIKT